MKKIISIIFFLSVNLIFAQSVRSLINGGVDKYDESNFPEAEVNFKKGLEKENDLFAGHYNLGSAYYKQGRYEEAIKQYQNSLALAETDQQKAKIFHNIGNSLIKNQKLKESIEAYKQSLKLNPNDLETKYNLSYALKKQQEQQQQNKDNKDQNKDDQNKDQQQNQDKNQDQNNNDKQNKDNQQNQDQKQQDPKQNDQQNQQQQNQPKPNEISKEEAQRILEALKNNEADLQKELRKKKGKPVNKAKDW